MGYQFTILNVTAALRIADTCLVDGQRSSGDNTPIEAASNTAKAYFRVNDPIFKCSSRFY